jgi:hypothetical protein
MDDIFIPRPSFRQEVTEALKDALGTGGDAWKLDTETTTVLGDK